MSSRNFKLRLDNFYYDTIFSSVDTFRPRRRMCVLQIGYKKEMKTLVVYFSATGTTKAYPRYNCGESRLMNR